VGEIVNGKRTAEPRPHARHVISTSGPDGVRYVMGVRDREAGT
jgi:hypothetical protein